MIRALYRFRLVNLPGVEPVELEREGSGPTEAEALFSAQQAVLMDVAHNLELVDRSNVERRHQPQLGTGEVPDDGDGEVVEGTVT